MKNLFCEIKTPKQIYTVCYQNPNEGNLGEVIYITLKADSEEDAINRALRNDEFTDYILLKYFDKKYMTAYKPTGGYIINEVKFYKGQPRA